MTIVRASVYVIGPSAGPQKIGVSYNPRIRRTALQRDTDARLNVHWSREYQRNTAYRIERIVQRKLRPLHLGGEFYDLSVNQCVLAIIIAERFCCDIEFRQIEAAAYVEEARIDAGVTIKRLAEIACMDERKFNTDYTAARQGKPPPRRPDILDLVREGLRRCGVDEKMRPSAPLGLTPECWVGEIDNPIVPSPGRRIKRRWSAPTVT